MSGRVPATLAKLKPTRGKGKKKGAKAEIDGDPIPVQFNPTSLKLQRQNNADAGGVNTRDQRRQYPAAQPATLTFDLEFDTAEEGSVTQDEGEATMHYVDVRDRTALVRQFVEPPKDDPRKPPPAVRFHWGTLIFDGLVKQVTEDLDYFAPDGTPLRAKLNVVITEQDPKFEANISGSGARDDRAATEPGGTTPPLPPPGPDVKPPPGSGPGRSGTRDVHRVVPAVAGESAQQLAARAGGDPGAWRSLMNGLASPLALPAGFPVELGPELEGAAETIGRAAGFAAGTRAAADELGRVLGLVTGAGAALEAAGSAVAAAAAATDPETAGFALAAAGGVAEAAQTVLGDVTGRAEAAARSAFAVPPADLAPKEPATVDPRALTYGRALPLRARVSSPTLEAIEAGGRRSLAARARPAEVPIASGPATPPWTQLPPAAAGRPTSDQAQRTRDARPSTIRARPGQGCR
ncbi:MAG TPA: hypothetical protein VGM21_13580 [Actinomycetota bacterium]